MKKLKILKVILKISFNNAILFMLAMATSGCEGVYNHENKELIGTISSVTFDHVVDKNEGCRLSKILFTLELKNQLKEEIQLLDLPPLNFCQIDKSDPILMIKSNIISLPATEKEFKLDKLRLTVINYFKQKIRSSETVKIECALLTTIYGSTLERIYSRYEPLINSNFKIESEKLLKKIDRKLIFRKSKKFKIILKVDDLVISSKNVKEMQRSRVLKKST